MSTDVFAKLEDARKSTLKEPQRPKNAFTTREYAEHQKIGLKTASDRLAVLEKSGAIRRIKLVLLCNNEYLKKQPAWQLIEK